MFNKRWIKSVSSFPEVYRMADVVSEMNSILLCCPFLFPQFQDPGG